MRKVTLKALSGKFGIGVNQLGERPNRELKNTTKFTTTTSINRERTGASTSVSAGNNELKKRSRSTTTEARTVRYGFF